MNSVLIKNVSKAFIDRRQTRRDINDDLSNNIIPVLENISLEFKDGEMICILGPSGCGKTTLLRIIAGFDVPTSGNVFIDDKAVTGPSSDNIFVFQHSGLFPWMTVWQNAELGVRHMTDPNAKNKIIREYIEMVELGGFENHYPYQLSGGMLRRAELARALAVNPEILIMDEPFSGLDFLTHIKMREEVVNMHEYIGKTVLVVTHDIDDALIIGDRIVVMSSRPSHVELDQVLDFPHPRNFGKDPGLRELRDEIYLMLGVSHAV